MTNDNISKQNNLIISNNSNQTKNIINNDNNKEKIEISKEDNKIIDNLEPIKKAEIKYSMIIQSSFKSANSQYIKSINSLASNKIQQDNNLQKEKEKEYEYSNKKKELLNPLIHFTNLSSKKLRILGSNSKSKSDS
jgi:hypothetical protein